MPHHNADITIHNLTTRLLQAFQPCTIQPALLGYSAHQDRQQALLGTEARLITGVNIYNVVCVKQKTILIVVHPSYGQTHCFV